MSKLADGLNLWAGRFAVAGLALCVVVFFIDMITRHFYLMFNDALSILSLGLVVWSLRKLK